jgi:hypothetical protein
MKKVFLCSILAFTVLTLSSFKNHKLSSPRINKAVNKINQQQQTVEAYLMIGGNWITGQITYMRTQQGFQPIRFWFGEQLRGEFWPDQRFTPLNQNNQFAKQYNWTHCISVQSFGQGGTAYLTLY